MKQVKINIFMEKENPLETMRHSTSHLLAAAILELHPDAKFGIGPAIENGFYYDFDFKNPITDEDLKGIEKKMIEIKNKKHEIKRAEISFYEARKMFQDQPYKIELINDLEKDGEKNVSIYKLGDFVDLCRGPHLDNTEKIGAFKLMSLAGAYWRGSEKNKMLTRIYGTVFPTKEELNEYLSMLEEAKKRDHRKIGQEMKLFVFSDLIGKGLPTFGPKGATIKRELERFTVDEEIKRGYHHIVTPDLAKVDLYRKSGHYPYYKDTMYPIMKIDEEELILKPMTCPHHFMFYKSEPHSYRELPYRIGEIAHQYRYEKSGELSGLTRVRMFCLADAHIIAAKDQAKQVIKEVLDLIDYINGALGLKKGVDYRYRLSLGDRTDTKKYYKDDAAWDYAENILREVLKEVEAPFYEAANEAAFYGPKIDIQMKKISGQEETAFTVQYDFVMPERFDLTFTNKDGKEERPIVIHRSSIGCLERTMALLIEKYAGEFPLWISPVQVKILPVNDDLIPYAEELKRELEKENIRVEVDDKAESLGKKIRNAEMEKSPYMIIMGAKEKESGMISVRSKKEGDLGALDPKKFIEKIKEEIKEKK